MKLQDISTVILAGGFGMRLRAVVADRPKPLAPVGGRPFIEYLLDQLVLAGARHAVISTGYMAEQVQHALADSYGPLRIEYSPEVDPLGTGGAVRLALPLCHGDCLLVMNGDSYCDVSLPDYLLWHAQQRAEASLVLVRAPDCSRFGRVETSHDGRVIAFGEKSGSGSGWINAGIYLLSRRLVESIPTHRPVSLEREVFPAWTDGRLVGFRSPGKLIDIGTPTSYTEAQAKFSRSAT